MRRRMTSTRRACRASLGIDLMSLEARAPQRPCNGPATGGVDASVTGQQGPQNKPAVQEIAMKPTRGRRAYSAFAASVCSLMTPSALANVTTSLMAQSERVTQVRINVGTPDFTVVNTPSGEFRRFTKGVRGLGSMRGGIESRGFPELPVTGFPVALPLDLQGAPIITVTP